MGERDDLTPWYTTVELSIGKWDVHEPTLWEDPDVAAHLVEVFSLYEKPHQRGIGMAWAVLAGEHADFRERFPDPERFGRALRFPDYSEALRLSNLVGATMLPKPTEEAAVVVDDEPISFRDGSGGPVNGDLRDLQPSVRSVLAAHAPAGGNVPQIGDEAP